MTWRAGDPPSASDTDWAALDALSDEEVEARALADPDAPPLSDDELARLRRVPPVRLLRRRLGMTQAAFATAFALPLGTVRDWEQGRKRPDAPARALLRVIEREPEAVRRALEATG
jgi:putative transcriptional regulator